MIEANASSPSIVVIRNSYDDGWRATVDGEPAPVLPTNGFVQGVAIGPGAHEIRLTYHDAAVATGLWLSGAVWLSIAAAWIVARRREPDATVTGERRGPAITRETVETADV